jgi:Domain of unknown function (DUF5666)
MFIQKRHNMKRSRILRITGALALSLLLAACGGGNNSKDNYPATTGTGSGTQTASVYQGAITGFGSVIVNGVRFSTVGASLADNDAMSLTHNDLHIGTTVQIIGTSDDATGAGNATRIVVIRGLHGSISAIAAPELTVLGQRVVTSSTTAYQNVTGLTALIIGDTVEAYGVRQADGSVLATLIEKKTLTGASLPGLVSNLDTVAKTFTINGLTVNYATALITGTLANGASVKVKATAAPIAGVLTATHIKVHNESAEYGSQGAAGILKIKGIASSAPLAGLVMISGTSVNVSNAVYRGGNSIVAGSYVEVRGTWNGTTLMANQVEFEGYHATQVGGNNELYGQISAYTSLSNFVVNGVNVDASTATGVTNGLTVGTYIEVKGNMVGNVLKATKIELQNSNTPSGGYYETYGTVSNFVSMASFTVNGMQVNASGAYVEHPERGAIANGRYIEMKGSQNANGVFIASKIEIKY